MDAISYSYADKQAKRIKKFIENPDSNSGIVTVPKVIGAGESVTIKSGRQAILADTLIEGDLIVEAGGDIFVPAGAGFGDLDQRINTKLDKDFSSLPDKATPDDTDNLAIQEVGGNLKKVSYKNLFDKVLITGTATFNGATQAINLTGIGNITLAIGDVIEVTGTTSNNKLFTVESIPNANQIIVNYEHRGTSTPVPIKRLINETANATIKLYNRAKNAPVGQGQGWCTPASGRAKNESYFNGTNRTISVSCTGKTSYSAQIIFFVNDLQGGVISSAESTTYTVGQIYTDIPSESTYKTVITEPVELFQMLELR